MKTEDAGSVSKTTGYDFTADAMLGVGPDKANKTWTNAIYDLFGVKHFSVCYGLSEAYLVVGYNNMF